MLEQLALEFAKATTAAAIASSKMSGRGDRKHADKVATEAMRKVLNTLPIDSRVVIGEGERDEAPMLYIGEELGTKKGPQVDIAVDPLEGTNLCASDSPNSICVFAVSERGGLKHAPDIYMNKLIVGPACKGKVRLLDSVSKNIHAIAKAHHIKPNQVKVTVLERERHEKLIAEIRKTGAMVRLITDGDICAGLSTALPGLGVHAVMGIGAAPEGVITAAAMRAMSGEIQGQFAPRSHEEVARLKQMGITNPNKVFMTSELAPGKDVMFIATGVTDGQILRGVKIENGMATTQTLIMYAKDKSLRYITTTSAL